ncbi:MAG: ABC transporter ATP-binding protein, partial [Desulfobulbaceae bacterium]|nr:ABC transporter ATP-binding protein [Desulfobulbaceae bacterium]
EFIVADEPAASLDLSVQAQVVNLLNSIRRKNGGSILYITHNLRMLRFVSQRMAVMYRGRIVEIGKTETIFNNPLHPYTKLLFGSLLCLDPKERGKRNGKSYFGEKGLKDEQESGGCIFFSRCSQGGPRCRESPPLQEIGFDRRVACCNL